MGFFEGVCAGGGKQQLNEAVGRGLKGKITAGRGNQGKWTKRAPATIHANFLRAVLLLLLLVIDN